MNSIKLENFWTIGSQLILGIFVQSNEKFPIVVGCSLQTASNEIVDIPARYLFSSGFVFWGVEKVDRRFMYPKDALGLFDTSGWNGKIIFALYTDSSFHNKLADTGWIEWNSYNLIGSSTAGLDNRDKEIDDIIENKYSVRNQNIWTSLIDKTPIDIWKPFLK